EGEERHSELLEELERDLGLPARERLGLASAEPRPVEGLAAEHVRAGPAERVPPADGDPELIRHALAEDEPVGVVEAVRERLVRLRPSVPDAIDVREERLGHDSTSSAHGRSAKRARTSP